MTPEQEQELKTLLDKHEQAKEALELAHQEWMTTASALNLFLRCLTPNFSRITEDVGRKIHQFLWKRYKENDTSPIDWNNVIPEILNAAEMDIKP